MNRLTIACFATLDGKYDWLMKAYIDAANALLAPFSMSIEVFPRTRRGLHAS